MKNNEQSKLLDALYTLKGKLKAVIKDSNNPFFNSKYADLNAHIEAVEPLAQEVGLILTQETNVTETGRNIVCTKLTHKDSKECVDSMLLLPEINDMQKLGSAITYARRYTLSALLAMKAEDDDGNRASNNKSNRYSVSKKKPEFNDSDEF